jgi:hypothetical protein
MSRIANRLETLALALSITALIGLMGCDAAPDGGAPDEQTTTSAVMKGGLGEAGTFTCDDGLGTCTCVGDDQCNDMFGSGLCGSDATCDTSNPSRPVCTCKQAMRVVRPKLGAVTIGKTATLTLAR